MRNTPSATSGSLIERAAATYGFGAAQPMPAPAQAGSPAIPEPPVTVTAIPEKSRPVTEPVAPVRSPDSAPTQRVDIAHLREQGFIQPGSAPTTLSEEFRLAKRQVLTAALGGRSAAPIERGRAIMVCSAQPNEGKTFCSVNLALSLASESELEVLLIDADVAKPEILSTLGMSGGPGLMDAVSDPSIDIESLVIPTGLASLSVLPAGRQSHTDTELLASARTYQLIDQLIDNNPRRIIVIDTAPVLAASAATVLAQHVGQIVMVVRADRTNEGELREALALFDGPARIQLLLNGASYAGTNQKYGSYYGYGG